ncbi:MAG: hypothetical protein JWP20_368 [Roseomonas sp.]|nr:hypothetical protein [Roseomonas sp.]
MTGFLGRWSRRKRGLEQEPAAPPPAPEPAAEAPAAQPPEAEEFDPASLPPLESLGAGSDLSGFLRPQVPALLRRAALRRVWAADPGIRDFTGPADYAWDYNAADGVPGFSLNLGSGDLKKLLAQAIGESWDDPAPGPAPGSLPGLAPGPAGEEAPPTMVAEAAPLPLPPEDAVRLSDPAPLAAFEPEPETEPELAVAPVRKHGGAMPRLG